MKVDLSNRVALIVGGSRGVGRALALSFARCGADVVITGRHEDALLPVKKEIEELGKKSYIFEHDATKSEGVNKLFSEVISDIGQLDILVNNLGSVEVFKGFTELDDQDWQDSFDLNVMSAVYASREALPYLKKSDHARIINIASLAARQIGRFIPHHTVAKAGMMALSKHLANILGKDQILVNAICPGTLEGEPWDRGVKNMSEFLNIPEEEARETMESSEKNKTVLNRIGTPEDVANLALFLSSDEANWITGACYTIDGGASKSII